MMELQRLRLVLQLKQDTPTSALLIVIRTMKKVMETTHSITRSSSPFTQILSPTRRGKHSVSVVIACSSLVSFRYIWLMAAFWWFVQWRILSTTELESLCTDLCWTGLGCIQYVRFSFHSLSGFWTRQLGFSHLYIVSWLGMVERCVLDSLFQFSVSSCISFY